MLARPAAMPGSPKVQRIRTRPRPAIRPIRAPIDPTREWSGRPEDVVEVDTGRLEGLAPGGHALAAHEHAVTTREHRLALDDAVLDPAGDGHDLTNATRAIAVDRGVDDKVDRRRDRGHDEPGTDVLAGQERQRAHLDQRLPGRVGVDAHHAGQPGVEGEQEIEALGRSDLADDESGRPHAQRLLDQHPQRDLAGALEPGLARLQRHPVGMVALQLEDLLGRDESLRAGDGGRKAVQQRGLAGLRAAGDDDVEPGEDARVEERRRRRRRPCRGWTRSSRLCALATNLRMLTAAKSRLMPSSTTCSRWPPGSIASTNG